MTRELVDAVLLAGGRYYLPYRLHATPAQFLRAYPQADQFFNLKRQYDPQELFQNQFYRKYGSRSMTKTIPAGPSHSSMTSPTSQLWWKESIWQNTSKARTP